MCEKAANRTQAQQHVMHQLEPSEKPDLSKTAISGKHFWIILSRVVQNFGPESSQGWAPERERERGRKRIWARDWGREKKGARSKRRRGERKHKQRYCATVRQEAAGAENRLSKEDASNHFPAHKSQSSITYNTCCSLGGWLLQKWYVLQHNRPPVSRKCCK